MATLTLLIGTCQGMGGYLDPTGGGTNVARSTGKGPPKIETRDGYLQQDNQGCYTEKNCFEKNNIK